MNDRDQRALDWVRVHCEPWTGKKWQWPSSYVHSEEASVKMARTCQALGLEPSDLVSSDLIDALTTRVIQMEDRLRAEGIEVKS